MGLCIKKTTEDDIVIGKVIFILSTNDRLEAEDESQVVLTIKNIRKG